MDRILTFVVVIFFTISVLCLFGYGTYKLQTAVADRIEAALNGSAR
jgi:archaellum component FlaG (FlaF/FlaG flagellin family)